MLSVAIDCEVAASQRLNDKIRDYPAIVLLHARTVRIEDSRNPRINLVLPVIVHHQSFGYPFALVITTAYSDRVDVSPILFGLRVFRRISVYFRGGRLQDARVDSFGQSQHIQGAHDIGLDRFDRVVLVMHG